jgi:hypothetical protein
VVYECDPRFRSTSLPHQIPLHTILLLYLRHSMELIPRGRVKCSPGLIRGGRVKWSPGLIRGGGRVKWSPGLVRGGRIKWSLSSLTLLDTAMTAKVT